MRQDVFAKNNSARGVSDRHQRIAFWACVGGFLINNLLFVMYAFNDGVNGFLLFNNVFYSVVIAGIAWSSYRNRYFSLILSLGIAAIYLHMWGTSFIDAYLGQASNLSFPTLLFAPLFLVLIMGFRLLIANALIQGLAVYVYARLFLADVYGLDPLHTDTSTIALQLALLSTVSVLVLAVVAYSREKTDRRLLKLLGESERLAAQDPLTGLKNRRAFMEAVDEMWQLKAPFAVAFIDLDRFKPVNDEFGHAIGDHVLKLIGERLNETSNVLTVSRFGGDEFAVMLKACDMSDLSASVQAIHNAVTAPIDVEIAHISVGASVGYALAYADAANVSEFLHAADTAMMRSKAEGGGVSKFDVDKDDASMASNAIQELFRQALQSGQIKAALQPIVDSRTKEIVGHELLARWVDSGLKRDPSPLEFIPIAEKLGLLNHLLWVTLDQAIPVARQHDGFLAINVSPSQLSSRFFLDGLRAKLVERGFPMNRLEIEVTEHVAFRNVTENIEVLREARAMGCRIVLDDFGAGYASLSLLGKLPLDKVKLDKSLQDTEDLEGVLGATIRLAVDLGFECCVEGVEDEQAEQRVERHHCHQMQGYRFGRPKIVEHESQTLRLVS